jgi:hypothetical protein
MGESFIDDASESCNGIPMRFQLFLRPDGLKSLDKIGGCYNLNSKASNKVDCAGIHS